MKIEPLCAIWHHLYNLKNAKNTQEGVLLLISCRKQNFDVSFCVIFDGGCQKFISGDDAGHRVVALHHFGIFLIFSNTLSHSATRKETLNDFYNRYQVPCYLWQIKPPLSLCTVPKYAQDCKFLLTGPISLYIKYVDFKSSLPCFTLTEESCSTKSVMIIDSSSGHTEIRYREIEISLRALLRYNTRCQ